MGTPNSNSTDAESLKYCCTPHSQSTTPSKLHTHLSYSNSTGSQFLTEWNTKLLACATSTTQSQVPLPLVFLSYYTFTVLPALSAFCQTHAQTPTLQPQNAQLLHFFTLWPPHLEQSPPRHQALCYSLFLQKQTQDISLLKIFQLSNIVQCVCVCIFCIVMLETMSTLCVSFFFLTCIVCVCLCASFA